MRSVLAQILVLIGLATFASAAAPSITKLNATEWYLTNGDSFDMTMNQAGYAYSMKHNGRELVRNATGGYTDFGGRTTFNWTSDPTTIYNDDKQLHVAFHSYWGDVHYIFFSGLAGHYQYVVNKNLGEQGEVRSLYRLDPLIFTHGKTSCRDAELPDIGKIDNGLYVQDQTYLQQDGSFVTKYDFSCFSRQTEWLGVYGNGAGAWVVAPNKTLDYYIGDNMKQELMMHRETSTDDAVLLFYYHGTHFMDNFEHNLPVNKTWGPWLFYVNDGSAEDAYNRKCSEESQFPYSWMPDPLYHDRGSVSGTLKLSDGRPASGAVVFVGDEDGGETLIQGTTYQYVDYADDNGYFKIDNVRREKQYRLLAWSHGGKLADVAEIYNGSMVDLSQNKDLDLGTLTWNVSQRETGWQIGDFDRYATEFGYGAGLPYRLGPTDRVPSNMYFTIGQNKTCDWPYAQTDNGNYTILFDPVTNNKSAVLTVSLAAYVGPTVNVSMNGVQVGVLGTNYTADKSIYRSATISGAWHCETYTIPSNLLKTNMFNKIDFTLGGAVRWHGMMYDAIKLEWE